MSRWSALALTAFILGCLIRSIGFDRDVVDFVLPEHADETVFYRFHPDEDSVVSGALQYDNPYNPPYTMYGTLPFYLLRVFLTAADVGTPSDDLYRTGRLLSLAFSAASLIALWLLARQIVAPPTAALAVLLFAVAPAAVQQAHYYSVDTLFCLLCTAALAAVLRAVDRPTLGPSLLCGVLIGLAASVRLNALLLGAVLTAAHLFHERSLTTVLRQSRLWIAAGAAIAVMVALQPYMLSAPHLYWEARGPLDFGHVMGVVGGSTLQLYTLQYLHTIPVLHQWTHLLPLSVGIAVTVAAAAGLLLSLRHPDRWRGVLLVWVGLYLLTTGSLLVKPVRYLLPVVPPLLILAADLCQRLWNAKKARWRWIGRAVAVCVVAHGVVYGLAYLRVWTTEDSRIQAGRWIADQVPQGDTILIERGAFHLGRVISSRWHRIERLSLSTLFDARGHLLCGTTSGWIERDIAGADWIAIAEVNRATQLAAAPEILPVVSSFYRHLLDGRLGYETVRRFKVTPTFAGIRFPDDGAEHTWLGFDHPSVRILKRAPEQEARGAWRAWVDGLEDESFCADRTIRAGARALRRGDTATAIRLFEDAESVSASRHLARVLGSVAHSRAGHPPKGLKLVVNDLAPLSLVDLGLTPEAVGLLTILSRLPLADPCATARRFLSVAAQMRRHSQVEAALKAEGIAAEICDRL